MSSVFGKQYVVYGEVLLVVLVTLFFEEKITFAQVRDVAGTYFFLSLGLSAASKAWEPRPRDWILTTVFWHIVAVFGAAAFVITLVKLV